MSRELSGRKTLFQQTQSNSKPILQKATTTTRTNFSPKKDNETNSGTPRLERIRGASTGPYVHYFAVSSSRIPKTTSTSATRCAMWSLLPEKEKTNKNNARNEGTLPEPRRHACWGEKASTLSTVSRKRTRAVAPLCSACET